MEQQPVKRHMHKGRVFTALAILTGIIVISVSVAAHRNAPESREDGTTETTPVTEAVTAETEAITEEEHREITSAPASTGTAISTAHKFSIPLEHLYIRMDNEKVMPLKILNDVITKDDIVWSSSDTGIAYADKDGTIHPAAPGQCSITAAYGEEKIVIPVTVREMVQQNGFTYVDGIMVANKTYSLPADYEPGLLEVTEKAFEELQQAAAEEDLDIYIGSDFRSYDEQVQSYFSIVDGYSAEYADIISARPGHSEHQTGYTIDCNSIDDDFSDTAEGEWLEEHCAEFGFIIRYPKNKTRYTGYAYESWHIRYVGTDHAKAIMEQGISLEEYLDISSEYTDAPPTLEDINRRRRAAGAKLVLPR